MAVLHQSANPTASVTSPATHMFTTHPQVKRVRCETSAAMVPKDKAIKRFVVGRCEGVPAGWRCTCAAEACCMLPSAVILSGSFAHYLNIITHTHTHPTPSYPRRCATSWTHPRCAT